ncbi:MAG: hypothetical protein AMXMBFR82_28930 [Candidatus Hydrogenedentota bacterium]
METTAVRVHGLIGIGIAIGIGIEVPHDFDPDPDSDFEKYRLQSRVIQRIKPIVSWRDTACYSVRATWPDSPLWP